MDVRVGVDGDAGVLCVGVEVGGDVKGVRVCVGVGGEQMANVGEVCCVYWVWAWPARRRLAAASRQSWRGIAGLRELVIE